MRMIVNAKSVAIVSMALAIVVLPWGSAQAQQSRMGATTRPAMGVKEGPFAGHTEMHNAYTHLEEAKDYLGKSKDVFGPHRANALTSVNNAMASILAGVQAAGAGAKADARETSEPPVNETMTKQQRRMMPMMYDAHYQLLQAQTDLRHTADAYGGNRDKALADVGQALNEVQAGMQYAEANQAAKSTGAKPAATPKKN